MADHLNPAVWRIGYYGLLSVTNRVPVEDIRGEWRGRPAEKLSRRRGWESVRAVRPLGRAAAQKLATEARGRSSEAAGGRKCFSFGRAARRNRATVPGPLNTGDFGCSSVPGTVPASVPSCTSQPRRLSACRTEVRGQRIGLRSEASARQAEDRGQLGKRSAKMERDFFCGEGQVQA
jgi:hypothetical protein